MEGWIYHTSSGTYDGYFSTCQASGANGGIVVAKDKFFVTHGGGSSVIGFSGGSIGSNNVWYHIALQRISNVFYLYKDGVLQGTATATVSLTGSTLRLGSRYMDNTTFMLTGYISNFRIVTGSAVYAASGFTPPTSPLTAISGTQLLTCQNSTGSITDASSNGYTITANGNAAASTSKPFVPTFTVPTTDLTAITNTKLLAFTESAPEYITTGSTLFDGTGDYLSTSTSSNLQIGTGDFTIEYWMYPTNISSTKMLLDRRVNSSSDMTMNINGHIDQKLRWYYGSGYGIISDSAISTNTWYHIALVRSSASTKMYINGTAQSTTFTDNNNYQGNGVNIGDGPTIQSVSYTHLRAHET